MIHLSARLAWHDSGWNGRICREPHLNSSCIVQEQIRDGREDELERQHAGVHLADISGWLPPCCRDIAAYADRGFTFVHKDPLDRDFLEPITEDIPPHACLPAPYRWMLEGNFRDICETEGLNIRGPDNPEKEWGWVYEPDRQVALLTYFWNKLKEGEGEALIFYYVNRGNPVDEQAARLVVGVGRLARIGPQRYFEGTDPRDPEGPRFPIWTRTVTQDHPDQGFRLPYQKYIQAGHNAREIACYVPRSAMLPFSYVGEHVTDDVAVGILEQLIQSVRRVQEDGKVDGRWKHHLVWLNDRLAEVWRGRGPFPGIGSVLQYLGFVHGTAFHRIELRDFVRQNKDPWAYVRAILEGRADPPEKYLEGFTHARRRWKALGHKPARLELLDRLVRFELTPEQVRRICDPDDRAQAGIKADEDDLIANPYLISELDLGSAESEPVALDVIDRGMLPEGDAALFIPRDEIVVHDDTQRGVLVRSKSEVIVANVLDSLVDDPSEIDWKYEEPLFHPDDPRDYRLPDFAIGFAGDIYYWEHLGMLSVPACREGWERKRRWYEERMGIPVVGPGAVPGREIEPGVSPLVITSRDGDDGSIDQMAIECLARKYILLE